MYHMNTGHHGLEIEMTDILELTEDSGRTIYIVISNVLCIRETKDGRCYITLANDNNIFVKEPMQEIIAALKAQG